MFRVLTYFLALGWAGWAASAQTPRDDQIAFHRRLAQAHAGAAQCLEAGGALDECDKPVPSCVPLSQAELQKHSQTHEMAGISAGRPQPTPSSAAPPDRRKLQ